MNIIVHKLLCSVALLEKKKLFSLYATYFANSVLVSFFLAFVLSSYVCVCDLTSTWNKWNLTLVKPSDDAVFVFRLYVGKKVDSGEKVKMVFKKFGFEMNIVSILYQFIGSESSIAIIMMVSFSYYDSHLLNHQKNWRKLWFFLKFLRKSTILLEYFLVLS